MDDDRIFTPRENIRSEERITMKLSQDDYDKVDKVSFQRDPPWEVEVTDLMTGRTWKVRGAECAAGPHCFCDAVIVREIKVEKTSGSTQS